MIESFPPILNRDACRHYSFFFSSSFFFFVSLRGRRLGRIWRGTVLDRGGMLLDLPGRRWSCLRARGRRRGWCWRRRLHWSCGLRGLRCWRRRLHWSCGLRGLRRGWCRLHWSCGLRRRRRGWCRLRRPIVQRSGDLWCRRLRGSPHGWRLLDGGLWRCRPGCGRRCSRSWSDDRCGSALHRSLTAGPIELPSRYWRWRRRRSIHLHLPHEWARRRGLALADLLHLSGIERTPGVRG